MVSSNFDAKPPPYYIAALHIAHHMNKPNITWFSQLVSYDPGIMLSLQETQFQLPIRMVKTEMVLLLSFLFFKLPTN